MVRGSFPLIWVLVLIFTFAVNGASGRHGSPSDCLPAPTDFTLLWWANGWDGGQPREPARLCLQTGNYAAVFDPFRAALSHFGPSPASGDGTYETAAQGDADALFNLPETCLRLSARVGDTSYHCVRAATRREDWMNFPVRIIESGRFVQRFDILQLEFENDQGRKLAAEGRLEVVAWPDQLRLLLELTPEVSLTNLTLSLRFESESGPHSRADHLEERAFAVAPRGQPVVTCLAPLCPKASDEEVAAGGGAIGRVTAVTPPGNDLPITFDSNRGWHRVALPDHRWSVAEEPDRLDRYRLALTNDASQTRIVRLLFDDPTGTPGITGLTPMLRDPAGNPTGLPVQISKNWHRQPERPMVFQGPWLHAFTLLRLPPHSVVEGELAITWARWGGVPAASHAQLCLVGWGWNQLWDQVAIGSWGESICYEPDAVQQRCRIDDLRPLMVWGMGGNQRKWTWTHNVGGGDFLVYYDRNHTYQPWRSVRTAYLSQGPNLTDVLYSGLTADGNIACQVRVRTPRTDDLNRTYHHLRYQVLRRTPFARLAFYQVGSDRYHWHQYRRLARGDLTGLFEEWEPGRGGNRYLRTGIPGEGTAPWFSLHDAIPEDHGKPVAGAWATRGLVIRSWKARLGGRDAPPIAAVFGTEAGGIPSANLELSPPPGLDELQPGDFVDAVVELLVLPMQADDYYGPNAALRASLQEGANTWRPVFRQASGNSLELVVRHGTLLDRYPPVIAPDLTQAPEISFRGGVGWLPLTFSGLPRASGWELQFRQGDNWLPVDQSVHGCDFWQTDYDARGPSWRLTFNVPLDSPDDPARRHRFRLRDSLQPRPGPTP